MKASHVCRGGVYCVLSDQDNLKLNIKDMTASQYSRVQIGEDLPQETGKPARKLEKQLLLA
jgi:hypothetical protein